MRRLATFPLSAVSKADVIFTCLDKITVKYFTTISASQVFPFTFSFFGRGEIGKKLKKSTEWLTLYSHTEFSDALEPDLTSPIACDNHECKR